MHPEGIAGAGQRNPIMTLTSTLRRCLLLCAAILCVLVSTVHAADYPPPHPVRVGFFAFDGYHMVDKNGERRGYGYELLQHLSTYANWTYQYVGYDKSWNECLDMLDRGEIDILTSAQKTPEREERFDYSGLPIGSSATIITARAGTINYAPGDYGKWNGIRVGLLRGNSRNESFANFARTKNFSYTPVYFDDIQDLLTELKQGSSIDVCVTSNLRAISGEWILAEFDISPFYLIVKKGNTVLLGEADAALEQLLENERDIRNQLWKKYYSPKNETEISYTPEEHRFIADMQGTAFTAVLNPDTPPLSVLEHGAYSGILYDITSEIIRRSGLNITLLEPQSQNDYQKLMASDSTDIILDARFLHAEAEQRGFRLSSPYLNTSFSRLYRKGTTQFSSSAVLKGDTSPAIPVSATPCDSLGDLVEAVYSGRQDAAYLLSETADLAVASDITNKLVAEKLYGTDVQFSIAVRNTRNVLLMSVLNKAASSISDRELIPIIHRHTTYRASPFSLIGYVYGQPIVAVAGVTIFFILILLAVLTVLSWRRQRHEHIRMLEGQRRNELLRDTLATAEQARAAKSQFLSRVSHEMRTPLNAIIGFMTLAKDCNDPALTGKYVEDAEIAAKLLLSIINDVLDMSAIEAGQMKIASAPFDFKRLIASITQVYFVQCQQKGITYDTKLMTCLDEQLVGDQLRVTQILNNLLGNALKFTETGHIQLSIRRLDSVGEKVFIRFEVSDTGCGMGKDMLSRLFRPFEQENAGTAQRYGGSGLGLSIVKSIVTMMGGAIGVKSVPGEGTTFTVDLPFLKNEAQPSSVTIDAEHLRVLVVDDNAQARDYASAVLKRIGVAHTCVDSGEKALAELRHGIESGKPYAVCLVDWKMPIMDGIEVTRRIRERYHRGMVVIVVSSYEHYQADESAREAGADMFVTKPLFQSTLHDLLMTLTSGPLASKGQTGFKTFAGRHVLLAEDNRLNRIVAEGLLRKCGVTCDMAMDGSQAVAMFTASPPDAYDAILMDIQMPNMDGLAATRAIRASDHPQAGTIPIIAVSADAFNEDIARSLSAGMTDHVAKPIELKVLSEALGRAFKGEGRKKISV